MIALIQSSAPPAGVSDTSLFHEWIAELGTMPVWVAVLGAALVAVAIAVAIVAVVAMFGTWLERKVSGHIQCRFGPMRVGWHGALQPVADGIKLLLKEDLVPKGSDRVLFIIAPAIVLACIFAAMTAYPLSPHLFFANIDLGVFFIIALTSVTTIGVIMAGWSSNSKWSLYGAMREAAQVVAYEIPMGLSLLVPLMVAGTFNLLEASAAQEGLCGMNWFIFRNPFMLPTFILFFIAILAETKRAPFDLPETESELVAGFMTEYSGLRWAFFFMEEYAAMFLYCIVGAVFFFGGFASPLTWASAHLFGTDSTFGLIAYDVAGGVTLMVKGFAGVFVMMWVRWTLPRVRIDQVMTIGYKYLTPLSLLCVIGAGAWETLWGTSIAEYWPW